MFLTADDIARLLSLNPEHVRDRLTRRRDFPAAYRLGERLDSVREVYAGFDGFVPQTAPEAYCLRIIQQMAHAAVGVSDE